MLFIFQLIPAQAMGFECRSLYKALNSQIIDDPRIFDFENKIDQYKRKHNKKLIISILDDEKEYLNSLTKLIERNPLINDLLSIRIFKKVDLLLEHIKHTPTDYLICDIDLNSKLNGFDVLLKIQESGIKTPVCIHSNRILPEDIEKVFKYRAKSFIPKPMTKAHLLKYISDYLPVH